MAATAQFTLRAGMLHFYNVTTTLEQRMLITAYANVSFHVSTIVSRATLFLRKGSGTLQYK